MKKQPHRSPDREVRLGAWKVLILHQAASKPVWGSQLFRLLIARGFHLAQSAFHDALNVMVRNGWLHRTMGRYRTAQLTITPKGREHLTELRRAVAELFIELELGVVPSRSSTHGSSRADTIGAGMAVLVDTLATMPARAERARRAMFDMHAIIAGALA